MLTLAASADRTVLDATAESAALSATADCAALAAAADRAAIAVAAERAALAAAAERDATDAAAERLPPFTNPNVIQRAAAHPTSSKAVRQQHVNVHDDAGRPRAGSLPARSARSAQCEPAVGCEPPPPHAAGRAQAFASSSG